MTGGKEAVRKVEDFNESELVFVSCSDHIKQFVTSCVHPDPLKRPPLYDLLSHDLIIKLDSGELSKLYIDYTHLSQNGANLLRHHISTVIDEILYRHQVN
jgi:hypothetical protein